MWGVQPPLRRGVIAITLVACVGFAPARLGRRGVGDTDVSAMDETLAVEGFETRVWVEGDPTAGNMKAVPLPADLVARLSHD